MKTTIDIPDDLYPTLAAASSAAGVSLEGFVLSAAREKAGDSAILKSNGAASPPCPDAIDGVVVLPDGSRRIVDLAAWWNSIPKAPREEVQEVQRLIDAEFSTIDPRDWE